MCGLIGARLVKPSEEHFRRLKALFIESQVRGKHATGLSWVQGGRVHTHAMDRPAEAFSFAFPSYLNEDGNLYLVGHCRYSTSDLEYNQPIADKQMSLVHNGVITQELFQNWTALYGAKNLTTHNDSELLFKTLKAGQDAFKVWPKASIAMIVLKADKTLDWGRNGKRPLCIARPDDGTLWIASTINIMYRAGITCAQTVPCSVLEDWQ